MTKTTKILVKASMVLASFIVLSLSGWAGAPLGIQSSGNTYYIQSLANLNELADYVNNVNNCASSSPAWTSSGKKFILMNDISGVTKPIGSLSNPFLGTFDGNSKKITLAINNVATNTYPGLFGHATSATIKNLTVTGNITAQADYVGGIVALGAYTTTITNCTNLADIEIDGTGNAFIDVGGIAGRLNYDCTVTLCANAGKITLNNASGGFSTVGGICGFSMGNRLDNCTLSRCVNIGNINADANIEVGGICGMADASNIDNCSNAGWINGGSYTSGIIGFAYNYISMQKCLNTGVVKGNNFIGSLIGYINDNGITGAITIINVSNCYYDKQMCPNMTAVYEKQDNIFTNVQGLNTNDLTTTTVKNALGSYWNIFAASTANTDTLFNHPGSSYPFLIGINPNISSVAAAAVRLQRSLFYGDNNINSVNYRFCLDVNYNFPNRASNFIYWDHPLKLSLEQMTRILASKAYVQVVFNPKGNSGWEYLQAYSYDGGIYYRKTVPIYLTGAAFKRNLEESNLGTFTVSELTPNIVTNQAEIDVTVANEGNLSVSIYNLAGSKVMNVFDNFVNENTTTKVNLNNLSDLISGVYIVVITVGNDSAIRKFIKQ